MPNWQEFPPEVEQRSGMCAAGFDSMLLRMNSYWKPKAELRHWLGMETRWRNQDRCKAASILSRRIVGAVRNTARRYLGFWDFRPGFDNHPLRIMAAEPEPLWTADQLLRVNPIATHELVPHVQRLGRRTFVVRYQKPLLDRRIRLNRNPVRAIGWTYDGPLPPLFRQEGFLPSRTLLCSVAKECDDCGVETTIDKCAREATLGRPGSGFSSTSWVPLLCRRCFMKGDTSS